MQGGHTREVAGLWLWCAHPLAADPVRSGDAQHLNGQGHAANRLESSLRASLKPEDARRCATVCNPRRGQSPSTVVEGAERSLVPQHCRLAMPLPATRGVPDSPKPWCWPGHCQTDRRGTDGGLHRATRAWKHMTTREAWPQAQAQMSESVYGEAGMQSGQHMQPGTSSMHCNRS